MSYIGSTPTTQSFIAGTDSFNGTGSATSFTLSRLVNSVNDVQVVVNNVVQYPPNYSVSGNTLTISPAPSAGTNNVYVRYLSTTLQSVTPPGGTTVNGSWGVNGNLNFFGNARRITGDFSNATIANRVMFQTSTANGNTTISTIPNGTGTISGLVAYNNADPTNASSANFAVVGTTDARIQSAITGTGTYLPMTFYTGGSKQAEITTAGLFQFNSGYGSVATAYGCRAWVNFNGTGTVAIRASGNVSSITDNGVGDYTVNFTTAMVDANYSVTQAYQPDSSGWFSGSWAPRMLFIFSQSTSNFRVQSGYQTSSSATADFNYLEFAIFR
jgi:hypothetical protein